MVTPRIDSKHDDWYDTLEAPREKATDPYVNTKGSLTLIFHLKREQTYMSPHETRHESPVETPEEH